MSDNSALEVRVSVLEREMKEYKQVYNSLNETIQELNTTIIVMNEQLKTTTNNIETIVGDKKYLSRQVVGSILPYIIFAIAWLITMGKK